MGEWRLQVVLKFKNTIWSFFMDANTTVLCVHACSSLSLVWAKENNDLLLLNTDRWGFTLTCYEPNMWTHSGKSKIIYFWRLTAAVHSLHYKAFATKICILLLIINVSLHEADTVHCYLSLTLKAVTLNVLAELPLTLSSDNSNQVFSSICPHLQQCWQQKENKRERESQHHTGQLYYEQILVCSELKLGLGDIFNQIHQYRYWDGIVEFAITTFSNWIKANNKKAARVWHFQKIISL